jgi:hypothetical protein
MAKHACFLAVLLLGACTLGGCEDYTLQFGACDGPNPAPPPDCPEVEPGCTGQCLPLAPFGWSVPALLWFGPELMAPECPADRAKVVAYEGHADLQPPACSGCSCKAPTGSCERPTVMTAYSDPACSLDPIDVSAPDPWDGMCHGVTLDPMLDPRRSVLVEPVTMFESECEPEQHDVPLAGSPTWGTFARACLGNGFTASCPDPSDYCAPTSEPPPEGFSQCVHQGGDQTCPPGYPNKYVFYNSATDLRECSACTCGDPKGGVCTTVVSLYEDAGCDDVAFISAATVNSMTSACLPIAATMTLKSKEAVPLGYTPGVCEARGGEPVGPVELLGPSTFCCLDD